MTAQCEGGWSINPLLQRRAGLLLHPTSLPSGKLDGDVFVWLDFMQRCGLSVWQVLPLVIPDHTGSPYQSCSAFAANTELLPDEAEIEMPDDLDRYLEQQGYWVEDFALFKLLKRLFNDAAWTQWPEKYRDRDPEALSALRSEHRDEIEATIREQQQMDLRWASIKSYARQANIALFGDLSIFVAHDSADVWAAPDQFLLDENLEPTYVTGVPPDYFSETGQRWGNPHYNWERMEADGFSWWMKRLKRQFEWFDIVRIDHFRALEAVWMIKADCDTAVDGFWQPTHGHKLLDQLKLHYPDLPIVAEDLGTITEEVRQLKHRYHFPGMSILQFAFDHFEDNPHKPANITEECVVYTGTHDNDTTRGWFGQLQPHEQAFVFQTLGVEPTEQICKTMINAALTSKANLAIIPLQDLLNLDSQSRMNTPGSCEDNWNWRFDWSMLEQFSIDEFQQQIKTSGRLVI